MRNKFDEQLKKLNDEMIQMGVMIEENIRDAIDALAKADVKRVAEIMERDVLIDQKQRDIEGLCFQLLIQQQPVAKDLRAITAAMKMVTDMERIGDHAADISEITILLADTERTAGYDTIIRMASEASVMLMQSVDAFTEKDEQKARKVIEHDDVVDEQFNVMKEKMMHAIIHQDLDADKVVDYLMVAKYLEKIGDHAVNIGEWAIFRVTGDMQGVQLY